MNYIRKTHTHTHPDPSDMNWFSFTLRNNNDHTNWPYLFQYNNKKLIVFDSLWKSSTQHSDQLFVQVVCYLSYKRFTCSLWKSHTWWSTDYYSPIYSDQWDCHLLFLYLAIYPTHTHRHRHNHKYSHIRSTFTHTQRDRKKERVWRREKERGIERERARETEENI